MGMTIQGSTADFLLGNSRRAKSLGSVTMRWAFSESPKDFTEIVCDVLPYCTYPIILGSAFLTATQTLTKYKRRLTECLFSMMNVFQINFLGNDSQCVLGNLGRGEQAFPVSAVPDTGAERNIMSESFAIANDLPIYNGSDRRNYLQFADGTYQETIGQVKTCWTFNSGERVPLTFEVLEDCCADLILGESFLHYHNVFEDYASSIVTSISEYDAYQLAPFDFVNRWQRVCDDLRDLLHFGKRKRKDSEDPTRRQPKSHTEEAERQEAWDFQYPFGETATEAEIAAEAQRRRAHRLAMQNPPQPPAPAATQLRRAGTYHQQSIPIASRQSQRSQRP
ncbi:MAG: hypothetical protein Q9222_001746 [Ikaeria aurantiellina]